MARNSILKFSFQACFIAANAIALMHILFVFLAARSGQFSLYDSWVGYFFIGSCILIFTSTVKRNSFRFISSIIFYFTMFISSMHSALYSTVFQDMANLQISYSNMIAIIVGLIFPLFGISISIAAQHYIHDM